MSAYFVDSSALVKRYVTEPGSSLVQQLVDPLAAHQIALAEITQVEVAAALAAKARAPQGLSLADRDRAVDRLLLD